MYEKDQNDGAICSTMGLVVDELQGWTKRFKVTPSMMVFFGKIS